MVPRMRTVSCADAGKATQTTAKLTAASMRWSVSGHDHSPWVLNGRLRYTTGEKAVPPRHPNQGPTKTLPSQPRCFANIPDPRSWRGCITALQHAPSYSTLIPASWITLRQRSSSPRTYRSSSSGGRAIMTSPSLTAKPFESVGLNSRCCRLVETVDDIGWSSGRREQAIPALRGIAGNASLRDSRQLRKCG